MAPSMTRTGEPAQEAAFICQGSAAAVMGMTAQAQDDLWAAVTKASHSMWCHSQCLCLQACRFFPDRTSLPGCVMGSSCSILRVINCMWQGDYGQYEPVSGSLQLVPRARGERRPCVPLRLYVMLAQGGSL